MFESIAASTIAGLAVALIVALVKSRRLKELGSVQVFTALSRKK